MSVREVRSRNFHSNSVYKLRVVVSSVLQFTCMLCLRFGGGGARSRVRFGGVYVLQFMFDASGLFCRVGLACGVLWPVPAGYCEQLEACIAQMQLIVGEVEFFDCSIFSMAHSFSDSTVS